MIYQMENNPQLGLLIGHTDIPLHGMILNDPLVGTGLVCGIGYTKLSGHIGPSMSQSDFPGSILFHYVGLWLLMKSQSTNLKWMKSDTFLLLMPYFHIFSILWSHIKHNICIYIDTRLGKL
jgi:hypothetical protein